MSPRIPQTLTASIRETTLLLWLVIVAVALPTVAFLWFMTRAMNNERAALREKSSQLYDIQLLKIRESLSRHINHLANQSESEAGERGTAARRFANIVNSGVCDSALVFGEDGTLHYPVLAVYPFDDEFTEPENQAHDFYYHRTSSDDKENAKEEPVRAEVRVTLSQFKNEELRTARDTQGRHIFPYLQLLALKEAAISGEALPEIARSLAARLTDSNVATQMPTTQKFFIATELRSLGHAVDLPLRASEELALEVLESPVRRPQPAVLSAISIDDHLWQLGSTDGRIVMLFRQDTIARILKDIAGGEVDLDGIRLEIGPNAATRTPDDCLMRSTLGQQFPGWDVRLFSDEHTDDERGFNRAVWIALAVLMIAIIGLVATIAIRRFLAQSRQTEHRNDFLSTVSHELKTPLTSTRMLVDTLVAGEYRNPERTLQYLEIIARENERLSALVENFLTYSRLESGRTNFQFLEIAPDEIAHNALETVERKFEAAGVTLDVDIDPGLPLINADDATLTTALINLLDNAFKYSGDDKRIRLHLTLNRDVVNFAVTDNGIGLSVADRQRVLERFFRADTQRTHTVSGTGLGLSIVNFIVTAHHGAVSIESSLNEGSTFCISIPVATATKSRTEHT